MHVIFFRKIKYALYSPLAWVYMALKGVKTHGHSFYCGIPYVENNGMISIGEKCRFMSTETGNPLGNNHRCIFATLSRNAHIEIGNNCTMSSTSINCALNIKIKDKVRIGSNVTIMDSDGHTDDFRSVPAQTILINDNVWIGTGSVVMKGVTIGRGSMIGAYSVCRKSIPPYAIVVGNPAKVVGFCLKPEEIIEYERENYPEKERLPLSNLEKDYEKYFLKRTRDIISYMKI